MSDKFIPGLYVKPPRSGAPDWVKGQISFKLAEFMPWIDGQSGDWINLDIKESKEGKWYAQINDWKPGRGSAVPGEPQGAASPPKQRRPATEPAASKYTEPFVDDDLEF